MNIIGIDVGTNSVGSAWVDTDERDIAMGVSVFPAGVEFSDNKRGAPKNQARRDSRGMERTIARKASLSRKLKKQLIDLGWMPVERHEIISWESSAEMNPWLLRAKGLDEELSGLEFGRVLLHLSQRRGAWWSGELEEEEVETLSTDEKKVKQAVSATSLKIIEGGFRTFGEFMATKYMERQVETGNKVKGGAHNKKRCLRIVNRKNALGEDEYEFCADRKMVLSEFRKLWEVQKSFNGTLSKQLTSECEKIFYNPEKTRTWKCQGLLFGQRNTYWNVKTLGRCGLEPTDRCCSELDMYAQEYLLLETVNNIRITPPGKLSSRLDSNEREVVLDVLKKQKTATGATIRTALRLNRGENKTLYTLSTDTAKNGSIKTSWFCREIISIFGEEIWESWSEDKQNAINKAILKFDIEDKDKFKVGCEEWWGLSDEQADKLIKAWQKKPKKEKILNLSRKAIVNLLPYMREGLNQIEARKAFSEDGENGATELQRKRYAPSGTYPNKKIRHFMLKHPDLLPPAPEEISNPVVRKTIHEVRRHIIAHIKEKGVKPDRIIVELGREAKQTEKVIREIDSRNDRVNKYKNELRKTFSIYFEGMTPRQENQALKRLRLCLQQRELCAYSNREIKPAMAIKGFGLEIDHVIPRSRGGNSSLSNLVLCYKAENVGKGNKTPMEWLSSEDFGCLEQRFQHLKDGKIEAGNLDMADKRKWDNLHTEVKDMGDFSESQLADNAYAAQQIVSWVRDAVYAGEPDGKKRVFVTNGRYTSLFRRDWGLFFDGSCNKDGKTKNRADHRHHAIDALIIAMSGPERIQEVANVWKKYERDNDKGVGKIKRELIKTPWGNHDSFRGQVEELYNDLLVSHRAQNRKVSGELHKAGTFGPVFDSEGNIIAIKERKAIAELSFNHFSVPENWDNLWDKYEEADKEQDKKEIRRQLLAMEDVKPGKSGIIRDRWFRGIFRAWLIKQGVNPDIYSGDAGKKKFQKNMKELIGKMGYVIDQKMNCRRVVIMRGMSDPVVFDRKVYDFEAGNFVIDNNPKSKRLHDSQNNHHIEIREDKKGVWRGEVIKQIEAAKRMRPSKNSGMKTLPAVDRTDNDNGKFVMSLSIGEIVKFKQKDKEDAYYVVVQVEFNGGKIHFSPINDAGVSKMKDGVPAREKIKLSSMQLQKYVLSNGDLPQKVCISPLGSVRLLGRD